MNKQGAYEEFFADDLALWHAFLHGNPHAFSTIYDLHFEALYAYGLKIIKEGQLVEDVIHDLFVNLWERRKTLGHTHAIKFYLFTCVKREPVKKAKHGQKSFPWYGNMQQMWKFLQVVKQTLGRLRKIAVSAIWCCTGGRKPQVVPKPWPLNHFYKDRCFMWPVHTGLTKPVCLFYLKGHFLAATASVWAEALLYCLNKSRASAL